VHDIGIHPGKFLVAINRTFYSMTVRACVTVCWLGFELRLWRHWV